MLYFLLFLKHSMCNDMCCGKKGGGTLRILNILYFFLKFNNTNSKVILGKVIYISRGLPTVNVPCVGLSGGHS